jgi:hypothetical protein
MRLEVRVAREGQAGGGVRGARCAACASGPFAAMGSAGCAQRYCTVECWSFSLCSASREFIQHCHVLLQTSHLRVFTVTFMCLPYILVATYLSQPPSAVVLCC